MWRKIHSNRDPRDTLYSELRKEFRPWFEKLTGRLAGMLSSHPRYFFSGMIALLLISFILSFTVFRHPEKFAVAEHSRPDVVSDGFSQIMEATAKLNETIVLKRSVDSMTAKKTLSAADTVLLDSLLNRLQRNRKPTK